MEKSQVTKLLEVLNMLVKSENKTLPILSPAFVLTIKCILKHILLQSDYSEVQEHLSMLRRLLEFVQSQKVRQIFISLGNCLFEMIKVHTKFPNEGTTESIFMILLEELSERHIECFKSILGESKFD